VLFRAVVVWGVLPSERRRSDSHDRGCFSTSLMLDIIKLLSKRKEGGIGKVSKYLNTYNNVKYNLFYY
jgi:hypothetical protein